MVGERLDLELGERQVFGPGCVVGHFAQGVDAESADAAREFVDRPARRADRRRGPWAAALERAVFAVDGQELHVQEVEKLSPELDRMSHRAYSAVASVREQPHERPGQGVLGLNENSARPVLPGEPGRGLEHDVVIEGEDLAERLGVPGRELADVSARLALRPRRLIGSPVRLVIPEEPPKNPRRHVTVPTRSIRHGSSFGKDRLVNDRMARFCCSCHIINPLLGYTFQFQAGSLDFAQSTGNRSMPTCEVTRCLCPSIRRFRSSIISRFSER